MGGKTGEFMSRIGGRPFIMKEEEETKIYNDYSGKQRQAIKIMSKRVLGEIEDMRLTLEDRMKIGDFVTNDYHGIYQIRQSKRNANTT